MDIGNTLRDARRRQDLGLPECETATRIRGRYLTALEDERLELLPEPAYARAFLRTYATFLGLDPRPLLEELDERLGTLAADEPPRPSAPRRVRPPRRSRRRRGPARAVMLAAGVVAVVTAAVWLGGRDAPDPALSVGIQPRTVPGAPRTPVTTVTDTPARTAPARAAARLRLTGRAPSGSWVQVRRAGPRGPVVFEGTIAAGAARTFPLGRLWMRVGWGPALQVAVGDRVQELPAGTTEVTVTSAGIVG